jgi:hypothetical protein
MHSTARIVATIGSSKKPAIVLRLTYSSAASGQATASAIPQAVARRSGVSSGSWMMYSLTPKSRTMPSTASSAMHSENTPTCAGVSRRASSIVLARPIAKLA